MFEFSLTLIITAATAIISILAFSRQDLFEKLLFSPYIVVRHREWHRVLGHTLVHADYVHLFFNLFVFYQFGLMLEWELAAVFGKPLGGLFFLVIYIGGAVVATLPAFQKHKDNDLYRSVGASGAVSAVLFAFILVNPLHSLGLLFLPGLRIPAFILGILYLVYESYMDKKKVDNIAHDAHIWGAIFGVIALVLFRFDYLTEFIAQITYYISEKLS